MIDALIRSSLANRLVVAVAAFVFLIWGVWQVAEAPVDVLPDLAAPTVTVVAEAGGMAPEEVERQIVRPVESRVNAASGVRTVRSQTNIGNAVIDVEFDWDTDVQQARQEISEALQVVASELPPEVDQPVIGPDASMMGEIMFVAVSSADHSAMELRDTADWVVTRRISSIPGVANVVPIGGDVRQYQAIVDPEAIAGLELGLDEVVAAVEDNDRNVSAGFFDDNHREHLIYGIGNLSDEDDIEQTVVATRDGRPVRLGEIADIETGPALQRGAGAYNGEDAVIIGIHKQPDANTLELTAELEETLDDLEAALPDGMQLQRDIFRQADFIEVAVDNVVRALQSGSLLVVLVIFLFLANLRATSIAVTVIPLSLLVAAVVLGYTGSTINTMTLGGMAIAVGVLVDDAIVVVENVVRRLRLEDDRRPDERRDADEVIFEATSEVVSPLFYANLVVFLVLLPLLFLAGIEGRLLQPLGIAFIAAVVASLLIALTVSPVMCSYLLPGTPGIEEGRESRVVQFLKRLYEPVLMKALPRWKGLLVGSVLAVGLAVLGLVYAGDSFLPEFNEGSLTVHAGTLPGTSLETSDEIAGWVEEILHDHPEVEATGRRTGRAEHDEHAQAVYASEIDVSLEMQDRSREEFLADLRDDLGEVPGAQIGIDQPISHRIDHMLTGTRASVAVHVVGEDLDQLHRLAQEIRGAIDDVDNTVDVRLEDRSHVPFLTIDKDREAIASHGLDVSTVADVIEAAYLGTPVGQVSEGQRDYELVVKFPDEVRDSIDEIRQTRVTTPSGSQIPLAALADIERDRRPNQIIRRDGRRQVSLSFNVTDADLVGVVDEAEAAITDHVEFPEGYYAEFAGQYQRAQEASRTILALGGLALLGILVAMITALSSTRDALLVLLNLPLALIGGVAGVFVLDGVLSVASLIGFVTLFGIATRNGLLLVTHIRHLKLREGVVDITEAVRRGAMERLSPIVMTAVASGLGLLPLALQAGQPGGEIQGPLAVVILCGLVTSTILNMLVIPALYLRFGDLAVRDGTDGVAP